MDDEDHQVQFSQDYVNQSHTYPAAVSTLQENEYVVIRGRPCEIVEISSFESGQYGDEMIQIVGNDLFTGKQLEMYEPSNHQADVPNVNYTEYQFLYSDDGFLHLLTNNGEEKDDVKVPDGEVGTMIQEFEESGTDAIVTVLSAMGEEAAVAARAAPK